MSKILVTGGCGFIGSHLCEGLLKAGHEVVCMDDLRSGRFENVAHLMNCPGFNLLPGNVDNPFLMEDLLEECRAVFHLAAMVSVPESLLDPMKCHANNVTAFLNILKTARIHRTPIVYASSAAVYGMGGDSPRKEGDTPLPCSPYGASKLADEIYASMAWQAWQVPSVGLRLFNVYGPRQDPKGEYSAVIARFADRLRNGKAPVIHGSGRQIRDFVHVDDVVRVFLAAASRAKKIGCDVVNVGTGTGTSILELSEVMQRVFRCRVTPIWEPERTGDIRVSVANISKMTAVLGVKPSVTLEAGLKRTFQGLDIPLREPVRNASARSGRRTCRENPSERAGPGR